MKRYWKIIMLLASVLLIFGGFYIKSAASSKQPYQVAIQDVEGARSALENIEITGQVYTTGTYNSTGFKLQADTTVYEDGQSFVEKLDRVFFQDNKISHYQSEYRNFMRGKTQVPASYAEDDTYIAYANDRTELSGKNGAQLLEISRLNKETGDEDDASFMLENDQTYPYSYVGRVHYADHRLYILVQQSGFENNHFKERYSLYVWNFETGSMEKEKDTLSFPVEGRYTSYTAIPLATSMKNSEKAVFLVRSADEINEYGDMEGEVTSRLFLFNFISQEIMEITEPEQWSISPPPPNVMTEETVYFINGDNGATVFSASLIEDSSELTPLMTLSDSKEEKNLDNESNEEAFSTDRMTRDSMMSEKVLDVYDGKLYIMDSYSEMSSQAYIDVYDLNSQNHLYRGEIIVDEDSASSAPFELYLSSIEFTE